MSSGIGYLTRNDCSATSQTSITQFLIALTDTCD